tara:strand:+ start:1962 stop:2390 length:429 start_codon:yes stop_codon:yes gene_type:complete
MRNKLMYIILGILVVSNVYLIFKSDSNRSQRNDEFKKEMRFLKSRLNFNKEQLHLAKIEFKRYSNEKKKLEKKLRRYDLIIIDNISKDTISEDNKDNYYDLAINLNELRIKHWRNIRNIANDTQKNKLDSIWSSMKKKIKNQ